MGFFAVNHKLRERFPELAAGLLAADNLLQLPTDLELWVALTRGNTGRLTGPIHTRQVLGPTSTGTQLALLSDAAVFFPPLAWQLVTPGSTLLDDQGWVEVTDWLSYDLDRREALCVLLPALPIVIEPTKDPSIADKLMHMFADELTPIVEATDIYPKDVRGT